MKNYKIFFSTLLCINTLIAVAAQYKLVGEGKPIVEISEEGENLLIKCEFKKAKNFADQQLNKQIDEKHGRTYCHYALLKYFAITNVQESLSLKGMSNASSPVYKDSRVTYSYKIPLRNIIRTAIPAQEREESAKSTQGLEMEKIFSDIGLSSNNTAKTTLKDLHSCDTNDVNMTMHTAASTNLIQQNTLKKCTTSIMKTNALPIKAKKVEMDKSNPLYRPPVSLPPLHSVQPPSL